MDPFYQWLLKGREKGKKEKEGKSQWTTIGTEDGRKLEPRKIFVYIVSPLRYLLESKYTLNFGDLTHNVGLYFYLKGVKGSPGRLTILPPFFWFVFSKITVYSNFMWFNCHSYKEMMSWRVSELIRLQVTLKGSLAIHT